MSRAESREEGRRFWEKSEVVVEFASREADKRMVALLSEHPPSSPLRVLDIGCAGGHNTEWLVRRGFDVYAIDTSEAMVACTRERVAETLGRDEAQRRVQTGRMQDLGAFTADDFDLVLALGVYHNAHDEEDWRLSLAETARVLKPGGRVLVSVFCPRSAPEGTQVSPVRGRPHLYDGFDSGPLYMVEADELTRDLALVGLHPARPVETTRGDTDTGYKISVNGLFEKVSG